MGYDSAVSVPEPDHRPWGGSPRFVTTRWSMVLQAGHDDPAVARAALSRLCQAYWFPLYAYARRRGQKPDDAQDSTQEFFTRLIEKGWLSGLTPEGGRFRSFLLTAFNRFLANEHDRQTALRRGGGQPLVSLDQAEAEHRYSTEPVTNETPEKIFERRWALAVLDQALRLLGEEAKAAGKGKLFDVLNPFLSRDPAPGEYERAAAQLGSTPGAVATAVFRLRQRYRDMVRKCVADTIADLGNVDEEMRHLFAALRE
jgi:RNA polymerase sigma factor (sigma-70 family)